MTPDKLEDLDREIAGLLARRIALLGESGAAEAGGLTGRLREELSSRPLEKLVIAVFSILFMGAAGWTIYEAGRFFWRATPTVQAVIVLAVVVLIIFIISSRRKKRGHGDTATR